MKTKKELAQELKNWQNGANNFDALVFTLISKAQSTPHNMYRLAMAFSEWIEVWKEWQETKDEEEFFQKYIN